jgi:hypothetical protein
MQALYQCLMTDAAQMEALLAGGMETMAALISADNNQSASVQRWATKNISQLRCFGGVLFSFVYSKRSLFRQLPGAARPARLGSFESLGRLVLLVAASHMRPSLKLSSAVSRSTWPSCSRATIPTCSWPQQMH